MKVQVNLSEEFVNELDKFAKEMGVSRSSLCAVWLGQQMKSVKTANHLISSMSADLSNEFLALLKKESDADC